MGVEGWQLHALSRELLSSVVVFVRVEVMPHFVD